MWENIILNPNSETFNVGLVWWFTMQMDKEQDYAFANEYLLTKNMSEIKAILKEKLSNVLFYHVFYRSKPIKPDYKLYLRCLNNIINTSNVDIFPDIVDNIGRALHEYILKNCRKNTANMRILIAATERVLKNLYAAGIIKNNDFQYRLVEFIRSNRAVPEPQHP